LAKQALGKGKQLRVCNKIGFLTQLIVPHGFINSIIGNITTLIF
jgi:hypothetical protein